MRLMQTFKQLASTLKKEFQVYQLIRYHPSTPRAAKWLLALAIGYVLMPFDLIPDFIPVIGQLDELLIVPGLIYLAMKQVPHQVIRECREQQQFLSAMQSTANSQH